MKDFVYVFELNSAIFLFLLSDFKKSKIIHQSVSEVIVSMLQTAHQVITMTKAKEGLEIQKGIS